MPGLGTGALLVGLVDLVVMNLYLLPQVGPPEVAAVAPVVAPVALRSKSARPVPVVVALTAPPATLRVHFRLGQARVRSDARLPLDAVAKLLAERPELSVVVRGHADQRGEARFNLYLSQKRARAVAAYLSQAGVARHRIVIESFGERVPVDPGHSRAAHRHNRRVELTFRLGSSS